MRERAVHVDGAGQLAARSIAGVELRIELASPLGPARDRLVLAEPLGEPARDVVLRELDREDVPELVPEHVAPVEGLRLGLIAASIAPKQTPWMPMFGRPLVRTLKCSRVAYISTCTGTFGMKP